MSLYIETYRQNNNKQIVYGLINTGFSASPELIDFQFRPQNRTWLNTAHLAAS